MSIYARQVGSDAARALLRRDNPTALVTADIHFVCGQSNAAQTQPVNHTIPFACDPDVAWCVSRAPRLDRALTHPFANHAPTNPHFGKANGWCHFAQEWFDLTTRRSIWADFTIAGQHLVPETNPSAQQQWSVRDLTKSLVGDFTYHNDAFSRRQLFHHVDQAVGFNPRFAVGHRIVHWVQGEQDVEAGIKNARITGEDYARELDLLFSFMQAEFGIDYFFIYELGRRGTTVAEIQTNEPHYQKIRTAQAQVANSRGDSFIVFDAAKQVGNPLNALAVGKNFHHRAGFEYQADGIHYSAESYRTMGRTGAWNAANALGLVAGPNTK